MEIRKRSQQVPFTTKDGSTIRSLLDLSNAPVRNQSLAEATLSVGSETERHYHRLSEEFYYILSGSGLMEVDGIENEVVSGDTILIPAGAWHQIRATEPLEFLCCCAPPYSHDDTYFA
jgi:mannose-6-phosphate isomerase-like protein (cupin superfamily)